MMHTRKRRASAAAQPPPHAAFKKWRFIEISAPSHFELGRQHGEKLRAEIKEVFRRLKFYTKHYLGRSYKCCVKYVEENIRPYVAAKYPDIWEEICGISAGAAGAARPEEILFWNCYETLFSLFVGGKKDLSGQRCSAFISAGGGSIIMAHNSHTDFIMGQTLNIMMRVVPPQGAAFFMQTAAGLIFSLVDWFSTSAGIIGCETSIANIIARPRLDAAPVCCRARTAMQYSNSIDDFVRFIKENNAGDYSAAWLIGDQKTGEIARIELTPNFCGVSRTFSGVYVGANLAVDARVLADVRREDEGDFRLSSINRYERLLYLTEGGVKNAAQARKIIADHFDTEKQRVIKNSHSICKHVEYDDGVGHPDVKVPFFPRGAYDGKVCVAAVGGDGTGVGVVDMWVRWGSSCGRKFSVREHTKKHPQFKKYFDYMNDFGGEPWKRVAVKWMGVGTDKKV